MASSVFKEAEELIGGARRDDYGPVSESFEEVAKCWSVLFKCDVTKNQVALAMIMLKTLRENNKTKRDNIVDIMGYAGLIDTMESEKHFKKATAEEIVAEAYDNL